jgi:hypothetical protein
VEERAGGEEAKNALTHPTPKLGLNIIAHLGIYDYNVSAQLEIKQLHGTSLHTSKNTHRILFN